GSRSATDPAELGFPARTRRRTPLPARRHCREGAHRRSSGAGLAAEIGTPGCAAHTRARGRAKARDVTVKRAFALLLVTWAANASAHKASTSYMQLSVLGSKVSGHWDLAVYDMMN